MKNRTKPPAPARKPSDGIDEEDYSDETLYKMKPVVPPKKPGLTDTNYCEIEFVREAEQR